MSQLHNLLQPVSRRLLIQGLSLALLLLPAVTPAALSTQEPMFGQAKPFHLRAEVDERPQLSREDMTVGPGGKGSSTGLSGSVSDSDSQIPFPEQIEIPNLALPNDSSPIQSAPAQTQQRSEPQGSMEEYGVDWAKWVTKLTDRWFVNLRTLEHQSGLRFTTSGPCLLKFTVYPNGQITNVELTRSSGIQLYDRFMYQALLATVPVAPFPKGTQRTSYTLCQGWDSHPAATGERDFQLGSWGKDTPAETVRKWMNPR